MLVKHSSAQHLLTTVLPVGNLAVSTLHFGPACTTVSGGTAAVPRCSSATTIAECGTALCRLQGVLAKQCWPDSCSYYNRVLQYYLPPVPFPAPQSTFRCMSIPCRNAQLVLSMPFVKLGPSRVTPVCWVYNHCMVVVGLVVNAVQQLLVCN